MRKFSESAILLLCLLTLTVCCRRHGQGGAGIPPEGDTVRMEYARNLMMVRHQDWTEVTLGDPWQTGRVLHRYVLLDSGAAVPPHLPPATVVRVPLRRSVVFTSAHCQLAHYLHADRAIAGVCDLRYMNIPAIRQRARLTDTAALHVTDCGDGMAPLVEKIISIGADALLLSPFENSGGYGRLETLGIPLIECADYMEYTPLGRAEWMKFYGLLYGRQQTADSLFAVVKEAYRHWQQVASRSRTSLSVLTERKTGSVWYCPGGQSTVGQMIRDARGRYAFSQDAHSGSLPLPFEQVLDKAGDTDVWAFKYNGDRPLSRQDLLAEYHGYDGLKAFQEGNIYECNTLAVPYFEEVSFRPDYLLREFVLLLHPDITNQGVLRYYKKIPSAS